MLDITQPELLRPLRLVLHEEGERDCFEWFMYRSAVKSPGAFSSHHWTTLLFQLSLTEPAVRSAMLTLASAHKEEVQGYGFLPGNYNNKQTHFTMVQYGKAITRLRPCCSDARKESLKIACISCALFVSTEFLRGHYTTGLLHLEHGLNLLLEYNTSNTYKESNMTYIDGWLITIFTRYLVQAKLLGQLPTFRCRRMFRLLAQPLPSTFKSIHHARRTLEHLMLRAFDLKEQSNLFEAIVYEHSDHEIILFLTAEQVTLQADLTHWFTIYNQTMALLSSHMPYLERFAYTLLKMYYNLGVLVAATCLASSSSVSTFDTHSAIFQSIITQCLHINTLVHPNDKTNDRPRPHPEVRHDPEPSSPNSVCDIGWLAPLYFTAVNCRVRRIRGAARRLLDMSVHREGIWSSELVRVLMARIVGMEEDDYEGEEQLCESEPDVIHRGLKEHDPANDFFVQSSRQSVGSLTSLSYYLTTGLASSLFDVVAVEGYVVLSRTSGSLVNTIFALACGTMLSGAAVTSRCRRCQCSCR